MKNGKENEVIALVILTAFVLLFVPIATTTLPTQQMAFASSHDEDANGVQYRQPVSGYTINYNDEWFTFDKNFRADGSMRMLFDASDDITIAGTDSAVLLGYFNIELGSGGSGSTTGQDCASRPNEEIAAEFNGGPHSSTQPDPDTLTSITPRPNKNYADTMHPGLDWEGQDSRVRWEKQHPTYSSGIVSGTATTLPVGSLCTTPPDGWVGYMAFKLNKDTDCNGAFDRVQIIQLVDVSGLNTDGSPKNNWQLVYNRSFNPAAGDIALKAAYNQWVDNKGMPEEVEQTIRIDQQDQTAWQSTTNPPYKFVALRGVTIDKNTCSSASLLSESEAETAAVESDQLALETGGLEEEDVTTTTTRTTTTTTSTNEDSDTLEQTDTAVIEQEQEEEEENLDNNDETAEDDLEDEEEE